MVRWQRCDSRHQRASAPFICNREHGREGTSGLNQGLNRLSALRALARTWSGRPAVCCNRTRIYSRSSFRSCACGIAARLSCRGAEDEDRAQRVGDYFVRSSEQQMRAGDWQIYQAPLSAREETRSHAIRGLVC